MDATKAITWVKSQGNDIDQAVLDRILSGKQPSGEVINQLLDGQRADGGWAPFWATGYSSLDATCFRLAQAERLGTGASEQAIQKAAHFLEGRQQVDGSWEEAARVAGEAPPWAAPGDHSARLYLTANCGFWSAMLSRKSAALRAAAYLEEQLDEQGRLPSFLHAHWLAAGLWTLLAQPAPAGRVGGYLAGRLGEFAASNLAWITVTLRIAGVAANEAFIQQAASQLEELQATDGHWPSEDGASQDMHATLEALRALRLCGRF